MRRTILLLASLLFPLIASAQNSLAVKCTEDYYLADAQYSLSVDGVVVTAKQSCAAHGGKSATVQQTNTFTGTWPSTAAHKVLITFLNDLYGGSAATDRNLWIWSVTLDGVAATGTTTPASSTTSWLGYVTPPGIWMMGNNGSLTWATTVLAPPPVTTPPTITVVSSTVAITCNCGVNPPVVAPPTVTHTVTLTWSPSASTVAGYNVYRSTVNGSGYTKIAAVTGLTYTDSTVVSGNTYYYVVTAITAAGVESVYSNQVAAVIPGSTLAITTSALPVAIVGQPYSVQLTASGGFPPYMWTLASGNLPDGLTLSITGLISGTPTTATTSSFTIQATDSAGAAARISF